MNNSNFDHFLEELNIAQRKAVQTLQGPVLVVAGPGTGKTQILALRIANILHETDVRPSNILCLTFTESGVNAMRNRLVNMIGPDARSVRIYTYHGFCNDVIQSFPDKFAFSRELTQLDDLGRVKIMREIIDSLDEEKKYELRPFSDRYRMIYEISSNIQTLKREGITVEKFTELVKEQIVLLEAEKTINPKTGNPPVKWTSKYKYALRNLELTELYDLYQQKLKEYGFYDYEDMILFVVNKLDEDDELLGYYQEKYLYILVDEYQDTNGSQNQIIKLLGSFDSNPNIFAVGDDDQAIYRFQGANVGNLLFFTQQFEDVTTIPITINYRSSQQILDAADSLIANNKQRLVNLVPDLQKKLIAGLTIPKHPIEIGKFSSSEIEVKYLLRKIQELVAEGVEYNDIAILYRRHSNVEDLAQAFLKAGIPMQISAGKNTLDDHIVQQYLSLLRLVQFSDENRDHLLMQALFYYFFKLDRLDAFKVIRFANDQKLSLFDVVISKDNLALAKVENIEAVNKFANYIVSWKQDEANLAFAEFAAKVALESGMINYVFGDQVNIEQVNTVNSFYNFITNQNRRNKKLRLSDFLEDLELLETHKITVNEQELDISKTGVRMMTAHKAKGLEFKHVFIMKCTEDNWEGFSGRSSIKLPDTVFQLAPVATDEDDAEDERRLMFVAMTRAKEHLYMTYAENYPSGNSTKETSPSAFLNEIDRNLIHDIDTAKYEETDLEYMQQTMSPVPQLNYSEIEKNYLSQLVEKFVLSPSALNDFLKCPLRFKFNYLLQVPKFKNKNMILGDTAHYALESLMRSLQNGELKDKDYFLYVFQTALERELISAQQHQEILLEGRAQLSAYYDTYVDDFQPPVLLEYKFPKQTTILEVEGNAPIFLTGKLDKLEWLNKDANTVRIIDYKSMTPKSENEVKGLTKNSEGEIYRQLVFYKLMAHLDDNFRAAPNLPKYDVAEVMVDFLKPASDGKMKRLSFEVTDQDIEDLKQTIVTTMGYIRDLQFDDTPEHPHCNDCEYCEMLRSNGTTLTGEPFII